MTDINDFITQAKTAIEAFRQELKTIRTNRISSSLVENLIVETYNNTVKLKLLELATIISEGPQTLSLTPFDPSTIGDIEKAILKSPLGISPITEGHKIILRFPPLSQEQREKLIKLVNQMAEQKKQNLRDLRDQFRKNIKQAFENKKITEDVRFSLEKQVDEAIKKFNEEIQNILEKKKKEILEV
ncbi:MAG: ribosome-recycling factor [Microgenomates group bacterium]